MSEDVVQPLDDLVEHGGVANQRRRDLEHAVAAVVGPGDQARLEQPPG